MIPIVNNHNNEVRAHIIAEFGRVDECCGVVAPTYLAKFVIGKPLQTATLNTEKSIPPGIYFIKSELRGGCTSHTVVLADFKTGEELFVEVGYAPVATGLSGSGDSKGGTCIDWRGTKKYIEE